MLSKKFKSEGKLIAQLIKVFVAFIMILFINNDM